MVNHTYTCTIIFKIINNTKIVKEKKTETLKKIKRKNLINKYQINKMNPESSTGSAYLGLFTNLQM